MIGLYRSSCYGWSIVLVVSMAMPALTLWMSVTIPADRASAQPVNPSYGLFRLQLTDDRSPP
jgi:hypothetical protein